MRYPSLVRCQWPRQCVAMEGRLLRDQLTLLSEGLGGQYIPCRTVGASFRLTGHSMILDRSGHLSLDEQACHTSYDRSRGSKDVPWSILESSCFETRVLLQFREPELRRV